MQAMRIIAGELRGRKLLPPLTDATRPVTDRVKQSVFDILAPDIPGTTVYDCFAGTGSMGLECLSRGAAGVTFFESDRNACTRLRTNVESLRVGDRSAIVTSDLFKWFDTPEAHGGADLIFLDPPYRFLRERADDLRRLGRQISAHHLAPVGIVVFRHDGRDNLDLPPLRAFDTRRYGGMIVEFLSRP